MRWIAYVLVVAASAGSSYVAASVAADEAVEETATIAYWNTVDACIRGNETLRQPLNNFFATFYADEAVEVDDPEVAQAARLVRNATTDQQCAEVVEKVGEADDYIPPEER